MKYKVGDRVRIVAKRVGCCWNSDGDMDKWLGKTMTIRDTSCGCYRMEEDKGCGDWYWWEHMIEGLAENHKIVITTDGKTTTARLFNGKELIRKAEAKCSPDDEFDFMVGAELAMERLTEKKPVNPFKVGDYVRVTGGESFGHGLPVGSVGRVAKADENSCYVDGFWSDGQRGNQWVGIRELEKI